MTKMRAVEPVKPVAPWVGGKRQLARHLVEIIQRTPHDRYLEPFVGMGGVFFRRSEAPPTEVINDLSRDVATLFRVLQAHYQAFMDMLRWQLTSRDEFERLRATDPDRLTDLQRAARFLYLQRLGFGGKVVGRTFGVTSGPARFDVGKLAEVLAAVHERLAGVVIECLPWAAFLERWDTPGALHYLDPPYIGTEGYYGRELFQAGDHRALVEALKALRGRFVLTINDCAEARELFSPFEVRTVRPVMDGGWRRPVEAGDGAGRGVPGIKWHADTCSSFKCPVLRFHVSRYNRQPTPSPWRGRVRERGSHRSVRWPRVPRSDPKRIVNAARLSSPMPRPVFIRFVTADRHPPYGHRTGVFQSALSPRAR